MHSFPLQMMPLPVVAVLGVMGLALFVLGVRDVGVALRHRLGRPTPVGDLTPDFGRVVVSGVARRADATVEAPLSGETCLAYSWRTAELRAQRGLDGSVDTWGQRGESDRGAVPFLVEDDTGRVLVDPEGAEFRLAEEWVRDPVSLADDRNEESSVRDFADQILGVETHGRRYYESRLDEGETITVRGHVGSDTGRADDRRRDRGMVLGGVLVVDSTPGGAATRSLRQGIVSAVAGLFVLVVVGIALLVPPL